MSAKVIHPNCPLQAHDIAAWLPLLKGDAAKKFRATIEQAGRVVTPIVIVRKGTPTGHGLVHEGPDEVLAGRNRINQALEAGIKWADIPKRDYDVNVDGPIMDFVNREDAEGRRHLDDNQRAIFAAKKLKYEAAFIKEEETAAEATGTAGDSADGKPGAGSKERISHKARKKAAKDANVSVDAVKKAQAYTKYEDLEEAVVNKKMTPQKASEEAGRRRAAEKAEKHATKLVNERREALAYLKNTFDPEGVFVKSVVSKKIFGDEAKGHKELMAFIELPLANQRTLIPLLVDGYDFKAAQGLFIKKPDEIGDDTTLIDAAYWSVATGLGTKNDSKVIKLGDFVITVELTKDEAKRIKGLVTA